MDRLRIKQLAVEDRPREKMLLKGASSLSDAELIAILIGSGNTEETAVQLAQRILNDSKNSLNLLGKMSVKELMDGRYKGIGEAKAITIVAAMELGRRKGLANPPERQTFRCSKDIFNFFYSRLCDLPYEELWVALTNTKNMIISATMISRGGVSNTSADLRVIMKTAVDSLCTNIALCHNHPSGSTQPSRMDDNFTERVDKAATLLGMRLIDHVIISDKSYYSYADEKKI